MALIKCPECGREISDKALACPSCGMPISQTVTNPVHTIETEDPVVSNGKKKISSNAVILIVCSVVLSILIIWFGIWYVQEQKKEEREAYINNLYTVSDAIIDGACKAEDTCNLISSVWYNSIFEKSDPGTDPYTKDSNGKFYIDFNVAIYSFKSSSEGMNAVAELNVNKSNVQDLMGALANPDQEFEICYNQLQETYAAYCKLVNMAIDPSGSYETYSEDFHEYDSDLASEWQQLLTLLPEQSE